jgi:hypothetical protein
MTENQHVQDGKNMKSNGKRGEKPEIRQNKDTPDKVLKVKP